MRNLASCIKAAIDFVSPESFKQVLDLTQERRMLTLQEAIVKPEEAEVPPTERRHADKLQVPPSRLPQAQSHKCSYHCILPPQLPHSTWTSRIYQPRIHCSSWFVTWWRELQQAGKALMSA